MFKLFGCFIFLFSFVCVCVFFFLLVDKVKSQAQREHRDKNEFSGEISERGKGDCDFRLALALEKYQLN